MEKTINCADCGHPFTYEVPTNYPDKRKYCTSCSAAKKAQWEDKKTTTPEGQAAYAQYSVTSNVDSKMPITDSEKVMSGRPFNADGVIPLHTPLMSQDAIGRCAGGLMHDYATIAAACIISDSTFNREQVIQDLYDAQHAFVKILEERG